MSKYFDGFVLPIPREYLDEYQAVGLKVGAIWKEYGALDYHEWLGDDLTLEGTASFKTAVNAREGEVVVFGWVVSPSKDVRDRANGKVPKDPRMEKLVGPLTSQSRLVFDATRMVYGCFKALV